MKKSVFPLIILFLVTLSCENEIYFKNKKVDTLLTMNGFIYTDSLENMIFLNYTGNTEPGHVENATVEVYINGEWKETVNGIIPENEKNKQMHFLIKSRFKPGDMVRIEAKTADGKHHAWIEEKVPYPVDIQKLDTMSLPLSVNDYMFYMKKLRIKVRFKDHEHTRDYYRIEIEQRAHCTYTDKNTGQDYVRNILSYSFWPWEDIVLTDGRPASTEELNSYLFENVQNYYGIFDDTRFKDSEYNMTVQSWIHAPSWYRREDVPLKNIKIDISVKLLSITRAEYEYLKVLNYLESDIYYPYIHEPVKIPGNVHGGTGMIGICAGTGRTMNTLIDYDYPYDNEE